MLFLHAGVRGLESVRLDRKRDEPLQVEQLLLARSLAANPARCWEIDVVNFGAVPLSAVSLTIEVDSTPVLRLPDGACVGLSAPVTDPAQLELLVDAYVASGPATRSDIAQLLAEAPGACGRYLYAVMRRLRDPDRCAPYQEILLDMKGRRHRPRTPWPREPA
jgi:hypothetical protein